MPEYHLLVSRAANVALKVADRAVLELGRLLKHGAAGLPH